MTDIGKVIHKTNELHKVQLGYQIAYLLSLIVA